MIFKLIVLGHSKRDVFSPQKTYHNHTTEREKLFRLKIIGSRTDRQSLAINIFQLEIKKSFLMTGDLKMDCLLTIIVDKVFDNVELDTTGIALGV